MLQAPEEGKIHQVNWQSRSIREFTREKNLDAANIGKVLVGDLLHNKNWKLPEGVQPYKKMTSTDKARITNDARRGRKDETKKQN